MDELALPDRDVPSYVKYLPHHSVDPEGPVVLLADNAAFLPDSLGVIWRLGLVPTEARTDGELGAFAQRLDNILSAIPEGTAVQFILRSSRDVRRRLDAWQASTRTEDPVLSELARSRRTALERLSVRTGQGRFETRSLEGFLTIVRPGTWTGTEVSPVEALAALAGNAATPLRRVAKAYAADRKAVHELAQTLESLMSQAGLPHTRLGEKELAQVLYTALNPLSARTLSAPEARPGETLRERVAQAALAFDLETGVISLDELALKVVSVAAFPAAAGAFPKTSAAGILMRGLQAGPFIDVTSDMDLVLCVEVPDQEELREKLGANRRIAVNQTKDVHQGPTLAPQAEELTHLERELASGKRMVSIRLHAVVRGLSPKEAADRARQVQAAFQSAGFRAVVEGPLAATIFLQCLPFGYRPDSDPALRRSSRQMTLTLAHLLPVYGSFPGTAAATQILLNRRGEPVTFGLFNGKEAPHALVSGKSGGGKSVYGNDLIASGLRTGGRFWVLDCGGSYKKLTEILGGTYVSYAAPNPPRLNPCGSAPPDGSCPPETNSFVRDWVAEMATRGEATLSVRDQNLVSIAVRSAFGAKPGREVFLSDVQDALLGLAPEHPAAKDLAVSLSDYVKDGPYARIFDGPNEIDFTNPLVAIDLAGAALEKPVQSVLVMALMYGIAQASKAWVTEDKYLLVDEAWALLKSPSVRGFIENLARTARKHRLALVILSQQITDLDGEAGRAILAQMSYKICLYQDPDAIPAAARLLELGFRETDLFRTLKTIPGLYSELFMKTPYGSGVARLVLDPWSYWVTTSDTGDRKILDALIEKAKRRGTAGREAVRQALREAALAYPHGAPTAKNPAPDPEEAGKAA